MYGQREYNDDLRRVASSGAHVMRIGQSTLGRDIHLIVKGNIEGDAVLVHGGIHAREYITTPLLMRLMEEYHGKGSVWCIPLVNIDGMLLATQGLDSIKDKERRDMLLKANDGSDDFRLWKANANAVDLNVNFNANWGKGRSNIRHRASANYIGEYPFSEVETRILAGITLKVQPKITLSYHTKGEVIYSGYNGDNRYGDIARSIAEITHYELRTSEGSFGGYKDWFMATTPYLGLTVECGNDALRHPLPLGELDHLVEVHRGVLELASSSTRYIL